MDKMKNRESGVKDTFDALLDTLVNYTSGGGNDAVLGLLKDRNAESLDQMASYWTQLLDV